MNSFNLLDVILFLGISQGLFLAITIQLVQNKNTTANKVLSYILLIATLMLLGRVVYLRYSNYFLLRIASFADGVIYLFGPLLYTYVRRLAFNESPTYKLPWYNFLPALYPILLYIWFLFYTKEEFSLLVQNGTIPLKIIFSSIIIGGLFSNIYYFFKSYQLVKVFHKEQKNNLSHYQTVIYFLYSFLFAIGLFLTLWLISSINNYFKNHDIYTYNYDVVWISIPLFIYVVGFYSLKQPEIFRIPLKITKEKTTKNRLEESVLLKLQTDLNTLIVEEKIYIKSTLTLKDLSEKLNASPNDVSWLLNNIYNSSFYDYINKYRVKEFLKKVDNGENKYHTLLALSIDAGFNSKSTFNKAFKKEMNETPSNYIKKIKSLEVEL